MFGSGGAVAGINGKEVECWHCNQCYQNFKELMDYETIDSIELAIYEAEWEKNNNSYEYYLRKYPNIPKASSNRFGKITEKDKNYLGKVRNQKIEVDCQYFLNIDLEQLLKELKFLSDGEFIKSYKEFLNREHNVVFSKLYDKYFWCKNSAIRDCRHIYEKEMLCRRHLEEAKPFIKAYREKMLPYYIGIAMFAIFFIIYFIAIFSNGQYR